jgi:hypothetical protein
MCSEGNTTVLGVEIDFTETDTGVLSVVTTEVGRFGKLNDLGEWLEAVLKALASSIKRQVKKVNLQLPAEVEELFQGIKHPKVTLDF